LEKRKSNGADAQAIQSLLYGGLILATCFLLWKLKALLLPIVVGALLAYLFAR